MAAVGSAVPSLSGSAVGSAANVGDLVNNPVAQPATERYPGPVDPSQYNQPGAPTQSRGGPVLGGYGTQPFISEQGISLDGGGGVQDTAWTEGHDGPMVPWDSSAGAPFAPSGPLDPDLHGDDTGGTYRTQQLVGPWFGRFRRVTIPGETNVNLAATQTTIGQTMPNGRQNLDQAQYNDTAGYDPRVIGYSERPILNNVAYQPIATNGGSVYTPDGGIPDRSAYDYAAQSYDAPPDPTISQIPAAAGGTGTGRWTLG